MRWQCSWHVGPDSGGQVTLEPGRHLVGRAATASIRCDDPAVAPHHLLLDVGSAGVTITRLAAEPTLGPTTTFVPTATTAPVDIVVGHSVVRLRPARADEPSVDAAHREGAVLRSPRVVPTWTPMAVPDVPDLAEDEPGGHGTLLPALLGVVGAAVMAVVMRQPMFVLFGAMGALVAVGSWGTQRVAGRRRLRQRRQAHDTAVNARSAAIAADAMARLAHLERVVPSTASALAAHRRRDLWHRRAAHGDAFVVGLGRGPLEHADGRAPIADAPVAADLGPGARVAITGATAMPVMRAVLAQLVTECGPADLRIVVVTEHAAAWTCLAEVPHLRGADGRANIVTARDVGEELDALRAAASVSGDDERLAPHVVIVTDEPTALSVRTGPLRRTLAQHPDVALIAALSTAAAPQSCTAVLATSEGPFAVWCANTSHGTAHSLRAAGIGAAAAAQVSIALAGLRDPEDVLDAGRLPTDVDLAALLGEATITADAVRARWAAAGHDTPSTPIGVATDGTVDVDLVRDGPHALLAGTTGSGKSELLRALVAGLAASVHPQHLQMVLVDYKGGATFDDLAALPHVAGIVTDLDGGLADRVLRSLQAELRRREATLRAAGAADLATHLARGAAMPRLLVMIDEFAALVAEQPGFLHALLGVAQRGRSLGVHLLLATQRPHGVISDDIRANTDLRIALRLQDAADAVDVVGDRRPATLPRGLPGRAVMRLGADEHVVFQTARLHHSAALVAAVVEAADGFTAPPPPWLPPLPTRIDADDVPSGALGWCDDPDRQRRVPLVWTPEDGGLLVAGGPGSGLTSTLRTAALHALRLGHPVHVIAARGDDAWTALRGQQGVVVVTMDDRERLARLLHRLTGEEWRPPSGSRSVVVVDGIDAVRRGLDDVSTADQYDRFDELLASVQHTVMLGTAHPAGVPAAAVARCTNRWVAALPDPHDAAILGTVATPTDERVTTPGRIVVVGNGLTAQLVAPCDGHVTTSAQLEPIDPIPDRVAALRLAPASSFGGDDLLPVGVDMATGRAATLTVPDGEHVLVLGGARSGRSTALSRLATAWRQVHPQGVVIAVLPRRSSFDITLAHDVRRDATGFDLDALHARHGALLVVADDAESIDDDGRLSALVGSRRPGVTVLAAARGDALRQRYGHWTGAVRHSRLGLVAVGAADHDGDLLGTVLPRRTSTRARPGLMWSVTHDGVHLVQVAVDEVGDRGDDRGDGRSAQRGDAAAHAASASAAAKATS